MKRAASRKGVAPASKLTAEDKERLRQRDQEREDAWGRAAMALQVAAKAARVAMRGKDNDARIVAESAVVQLLESVRGDLAPFIVSVDSEPGWLAYQAARFVAARD